MSDKIQCELLTWGEIQRLTRRLAQLVKSAGYQPDVIVAIARGGYVPARMVCDFLNIYNLTSLRVAHYTSTNQKNEAARLSTPLNIDVRGLKVLIIDDVSDTGDTLQVTLEHIHSFDPAEVKVGVLHHKTVSYIEPDFYAKKIIKWRWLIYPWAVIEDLRGLISAMEPVSVSDAGKRLKAEHGICVNPTTLEDVYSLISDTSKKSKS
ncbi:phosphoribosyltransferase [Pseudomonadota bacterium]